MPSICPVQIMNTKAFAGESAQARGMRLTFDTSFQLCHLQLPRTAGCLVAQWVVADILPVVSELLMSFTGKAGNII